MRKTSIDTYYKILNNGMLSKRRQEVYEEIYKNGPASIADVRQRFRSFNPEMSDSSVSTRFSELERLGVIEEVGKKKDERTGNECTLWDITNNLPVKLKKGQTRKEQVDELLKYITTLVRKIAFVHKDELLAIYYKVTRL